MGFSLRPFGKKIWETLTPQNEEAMRRANASINSANRKISGLGPSAKGVLGNQSYRQNFTQQNQPSNFNLGRSSLTAFADTLSGKADPAGVGSFKGSGLIEDFLYSPSKMGGGVGKIQDGQVKEGIGQIVTGAIEGPLGFVPVAKAAQAGKGASLLTKVGAGAKQGMKEGAVYGGAYGAGAAAEQNASPEDIIKSGVVGTATGGLAGAALGGGVPLAVAGAKATGRGATQVAINETGSIGLKPKASLKDDLNTRLNTEAEIAKNRYKVSKPVATKNTVLDAYDPARPLASVDKATARARAVPFRNLPATERLEALYDISNTSRQQAEEILKAPTRTGQSGFGLIQKYGDEISSKEFNNYTNAKFDLEFRAKHKGKPIQRNIKTEELDAFIKDYEARNPDAVADLATNKALNDQAIDLLVESRVFSKTEGEYIKNSYQNAVPLSRVVSEDLKRIPIGGKSSGSIARQSVVQKLLGNSDTPLDNTFKPLVDRINKAVSQSNRAKLAQLYAERVKEGTAPGRLLVGEGNKTVRKETRGVQQEVNATLKQVNLKLAKVKNPKRKAELKRQQAGLLEAKKINKETVAQFQDDPTTGKQVISGIVDGEQFKIEVPPEIAKVMQGLDETQMNTLLRVGYGVNKVFQTAWTGFLQPIFSLFSYTLYDPAASVIVSKHGFKTFRPSAIKQMLLSFRGNNEFSQALKQNGYLSPGGSQMARDTTLNAEKIAASANLGSKLKFNIKHPSELREALDVLGGKLANSSRERIAKAHYIAAKKANMTEEQAIAEAVYAGNNVLPNYQRTSALVKQLNAVIPYSGASVAGTRAIMRSLGSDPGAWARLAAVGVAPPVAAVAYTLGSDEGQAYIKDMLDSGKGYVLDNNINIALPGIAKKDPKTGEWTGVWKIPVAPELRALNKTVWRTTASSINDGEFGADPKTVALSIFDTMTGGMRGQSNPAIDTALIGLNIDPRTFEPVVKGDLALEDKKDQTYDSTTGAGKAIASLTGNRISPIQGDEVLQQFSLLGQLFQNREGNPAKTVATNFVNRIYGAYGQKEGAKFFEEFDRLLGESDFDPDDRKIIASLHSKDPQPGILDSAEKATNFLNRPAVVKFERELDAWNRKQGKPGNPLFDLSDEQLNQVLVYRQSKMLKAGKQTFDKNGNPLFIALGLDNKWYDDFRKKEDAFYKSLPLGDKKAPETFSGQPRLDKPKDIETIENAYYKLPSGTGERSRFLRANPKLLAWWELSDGFTDKERAAIGLKNFKDKDSFANSSRRGGGSGSKGSRGAGSDFKYAVSLSAGGKSVKPKVKAPAKGRKRAGKKTASQPKVTIKKSLV